MTMKQTRNIRIFFQYVIPSVLSFALSGGYAIVDGFFIGNSIGDLGLSAVNVAYPVVGVIQALGTGSGARFCTDSIGGVSSSPKAVCG